MTKRPAATVAFVFDRVFLFVMYTCNRARYQRCDAHQCALMSTRPFDQEDLVNSTYCFSKLLQDKQVRQRLSQGMKRVIRDDLARNIFIGIPPPAESREALKLLVDYALEPILRWSQSSSEVDVLPRLQRLKDSIKQGVHLFKCMYNGLSHKCVTHYCWLPEGGRCCDSTEDVIQKVCEATDKVIMGSLLAGSPDPTTVKWFSIAVRFRSMVLGNGCHGLLSRAWLSSFVPELMNAEENAGEDDQLVDDNDGFQATNRKRHRKVAQFWHRTNLQSR